MFYTPEEFQIRVKEKGPQAQKICGEKSTKTLWIKRPVKRPPIKGLNRSK